ncbi:MAG: Ig-like domain-containing protein [Planctomycetota bacterium]
MNSAGATYGGDIKFTTHEVAPTAVTNEASNVNAHAAVLNGIANAQCLATTIHFEVGKTLTYGTTTADQDIGAGNSDVPVTAAVINLDANTEYHARLVAVNSAGATYGGDIKFTTHEEPDTIPPTVLSVSPLDNGTNVSVSGNISVEFSETMNQSTAQSAFSIVPPVAGEFSWSNNYTMTFNPTDNLSYNTHYIVTVSTEATDLAGNHMAVQYQWSFTTQLDTTLHFFLASPPNGSDCFTPHPTFSWTNAEGAVKYTLYIYESVPPQGTPLVTVTDIHDTTCALTQQALETGKQYSWIVEARDSENNITLANDGVAWSFTCVGSSYTFGDIATAAPCETSRGAKGKAGSTIDYSSGNLNIDVDVTHIVSNTAFETNITLYYNSLDTSLANGPLGPNWTHTFNQSIKANPDGSLSYRFPSGKQIVCRFNSPTGKYIPLPEYGDHSELTIQSGSYILTKKDKTVYTFNSSGQLTQIRDRNNNTMTLTYTGNNLTTITLPGGRTITLSYTNNLIYQITDPASNVTTLSYSSGQLQTIAKTGGWQWSFSYVSGNRISFVTKPGNIVTGYEYNTDNRLNKVTNTINGIPVTRTFTYNSDSIVDIKDRDGNISHIKYDLALDARKDATDADGNITHNTFDSNRNLTKQTSPLGFDTAYDYDARGNVTRITDVLGHTTNYHYDDTNNPDFPTRIIDDHNVTTKMIYDANNGNLTERTEAFGTDAAQVTTYEYYPSGDQNAGRLKKKTRDPGVYPHLNLITKYEYNTNGYLYRTIIDPTEYNAAGLNIIYQTTYDALGQVDTSSCPRSLQPSFQYTYDDRGNRLTVRTYITPPTSYLATFDYDLTDYLNQKTEDSGTGGLNIITKYDHDDIGRLISTIVDYGVGTNYLNITTSTEYDGEGRVKKTTDPEGATTEYSYYGNGWLESVNRELKDSEPNRYALAQYFYDANGNRRHVIDPVGHNTYYTYTNKDQLYTVTDPESNVTRYDYNELGLTNWVQDARGKKTYTFYDELRRVKYVRTAQDNITTAYVYDKAGRTTQVIGPWYDTNQNGIVDGGEYATPAGYMPTRTPPVRYTTYDNADRPKETWVNSHSHTIYGYDKAGNHTSVTDPTGVITERQYDRCAELTLVKVDPTGLNEQTFYEYDVLGRQIRVTAAYTSPLATTTHFEYDKAGRLKTQYTGSLLYATHYEYNKRGQQTKVYDAEGWAANPKYFTEYQYDKSGRLLKVINAENHYTRYEYDKDGNRTDVYYVRNSAEVNTHYTYYDNHLLHTTTYPGFDGTNTTTLIYDGNGNLMSKTDGKGTITYTNDYNNRLTGKAYPDSSTVAYTLDAAGNLLTILDPNTNTVNTFDDLNRLTNVTNNKLSKSIAYNYYEDGTRKSMDGPESDNTVSYAYDNAKRLKTVKLNNIVTGSYDYSKLSLRTKLTEGNGAYTDYTYDPTTRWLTGVYNKKSGGTIISSFVYTHDKVGNRKTMKLTSGDVVDYDYDQIYQLTDEARTGTSPYQIHWGYDEVGNRLTQNKDGAITNYTYNNANQLISEISGGITTTYEFDANGNQVKRTKGAEISTWSYDYENRQISYEDLLNKGSYSYDAYGRRIRHTSVITAFKSGGTQNASEKIGVGNGKGQGRENGQGIQNALSNMMRETATTTQFIYDGANIIADYDQDNVIQASYITPFLDQNLVINKNGNTYYYMSDGLGSIRNIINAGQVTKNEYDYTAFGEPLSWSEKITNRYTYTSREWDAESGTYYYRARQYNPYSGGFTARDPIEYAGGLNLYGYVGNNPVNRTDPSGLVVVVEGSQSELSSWRIPEYYDSQTYNKYQDEPCDMHCEKCEMTGRVKIEDNGTKDKVIRVKITEEPKFESFYTYGRATPGQCCKWYIGWWHCYNSPGAGLSQEEELGSGRTAQFTVDPKGTGGTTAPQPVNVETQKGSWWCSCVKGSWKCYPKQPPSTQMIYEWKWTGSKGDWVNNKQASYTPAK